jgi:hypothetical protein
MAYPQDQEQQQPLTSQSNLTSVPEDLSTQPSSFHEFQKRAPALRNRPGYARVPSVSFADERNGQQAEVLNHEPPLESRDRASSHGLGIALPLQHASVESINIQPVRKHGPPGEIFTAPDPSTPGSAKPLMSPPSTGGLSGSTKYDSPYSDWDTSYTSTKLPAKQSHVSLQSSVQPSIYANSEAGLLSIRSRYDSFAPQHQCVSTTNFKRPRLNWLSITILVFAVYSTLWAHDPHQRRLDHLWSHGTDHLLCENHRAHVCHGHSRTTGPSAGTKSSRQEDRTRHHSGRDQYAIVDPPARYIVHALGKCTICWSHTPWLRVSACGNLSVAVCDRSKRHCSTSTQIQSTASLLDARYEINHFFNFHS